MTTGEGDGASAGPAGIETIVPAGEDWPDTPAFAVLPNGATRGVVVIHEIFGRRPEIDRVVLRFGRAGYAAVAPDLFRAPSALGCIRRTMTAMRTGEGPAVRHAAGVRAWLSQNAGIPAGSIGIIGFCFGGGFALAVGRGWGAISTNYGVVPTADVMRGLGPTIGCYGARDVNFRGMAKTLEERLTSVGVPVETHTYPDVGHSFLTDGAPGWAQWLTWPLMHIEYRPETAEDAWAKILAFFEKHLTPGATPDPSRR